MADKTRKRPPAAADIARIAAAHFAAKVDRITAPGGKGRDSVRVHFGDRSVIATWRAQSRVMDRELAVMEALSRVDGPVPRPLGRVGDILFQEDMGSRRLTAEFRRADPDGKARLARAALASILALQEAADRAGLTARSPGIGMSDQWISAQIAGPAKLSATWKIAPPALDRDQLAPRLAARAERFVKWDSRPGNAGIRDGRIVWFDWEHSGRRWGFEDFCWLGADEFWPLAPTETLAAIEDVIGAALAPDPRRRVIAFATMQAVHRMRLISDRIGRAGWMAEDDALRYDKIGAAPALLSHLAGNARQWAAMDEATAPLSGWFAEMADAVTARVPPPVAAS